MKGSVGTVSTFFDEMDERVIRLLSRYGILFLRVSLGLTFVWFGALKVFDVSPVAELVAGVVYWVPPALFVPFLGVWEILVGIGLLSGRFLRVTLLFFLMQMAGTFLVLLVKPEVAFQGYNLLLLTTEGEFVIKNLVLISGGLVVGSTVQSRREGKHGTRGETVAGH
ncbi:MAG: DoxX family membrane protein [Rubrobacteraceae bacterium]